MICGANQCTGFYVITASVMKGLNVPYFFHLFPPPSIKVGFVGLLRKKVKQYPVFYDKQIKEYREKDAVSKV